MVLLMKTTLLVIILMELLVIPVGALQVNRQIPATSEAVSDSGRSSHYPGRTAAYSKLLMQLFSQLQNVPKSDTVISGNVASRFPDYYSVIQKPFSLVGSFHKGSALQYNSLQFLGHSSLQKFGKTWNIRLLKKEETTDGIPLFNRLGPAYSRVKRQARLTPTSTQDVTPTFSSTQGGDPSPSPPSINITNSSGTSSNIVLSSEPSSEPRSGVDLKNKTTGRSPTSVVVANASQSDGTDISTAGSTQSQISVASGKGNKAGVTPSSTTPLSLVSRSSDASLNSSYLTENVATSLSKFSRRPDNVTASTGEPKAIATTDYTDTQTLLTQISSGQAGASIPTPEPEKPPLVTETQGHTTKPLTTATSKTTTENLSSSNGKITPASPHSSAGSSKVVTNGTAVDGKTSVPEPETSLPSPEPVPEGEGTPEPVPEGEGTPEPVPEGEGTPEPETGTMKPENNSGEPTAESIVPFAEPVPNFEEAKKVWKEAWPIHIYSMGIAFSLLAVFSLISIIRLWRIKHLFSQKYFISLNLLMFLMGVIRGVYLLVDGYNSKQVFSRVLDYFLLSTGFPCLTSAFSILFFALLQATRMQLVGPRVQKIQVLIAIIVCHFGISIITDVVVGYFYGARIMLFLCELISVLWGLFLVIGYCYIFRRLYAAALKRQRVMERLSNVRSSRSPGVNGTSPDVSDRKPSRSDSSIAVKPSQKYTLSLAVKVTMGTAILGLVYIGLEMYGMFGVFGVFSQKEPEPWPWWGFEFGLRLVELFMCVTMSYIGTQPFRYVEGLRTRRWCFYCAACMELFRPRCGSQAGNDHLAWHEIGADLSNSAASDQDSAPQPTRIVYRKRSKSKSPPKKLVPYEAVQMQVKLNAQNGHAGSGVNGHINPSLEAGVDSRPVSMLVFEDGFIRFRNDDELVVVMLTGDESATRDSAELTPSSRCANDLVTGAQDLSQTNANTNDNQYDRSMPYGGGLANSEHEHGIVNDGFSGGADSSRNSGVIPDGATNPVLPLCRLRVADGESDAYSASSMQSFARSKFSESIEQELQNLIVKKSSEVVEKAKSSTNLPADIEDSYFTNMLTFTENSPKVLTGIRSPPHEHVMQNFSNPVKSMPCSPLKTSLESASEKKKLLSRSNSDHLPMAKHASVRTKVYKNAKYFSLSDLELQIKSDDLRPGLEPVHPPPQFNPVKLLSSSKVPESEKQIGSLDPQEVVKAKNGSVPRTNGSNSPKKTSKTKKNQEEKSKTGDSDQSEC